MEVTKPLEDNRFPLSSTMAPSGMAMALSLSSEVPVDARQATSTQKHEEPVHHGPWYPLLCLCGHCVCVCMCAHARVHAKSLSLCLTLCNPMDCGPHLSCPLRWQGDSLPLHHLGSPSVAITNHQPRSCSTDLGPSVGKGME